MHNNKPLRRLLPTILIALVLGYFAYHAIQGDRGLITYFRLRADLNKSEIQRDELAIKRQQLESEVQQLRPDHVDPDRLEEEAKRSLGYAKKNELMIVLPKAQPPANDPSAAAVK
ncbi:MAG: septum formation initiator family protein [Dongiaceae bacterium]